MKDHLAIVIIVYNTQLIHKQIECIKKFCKDERYEIVVVDNSNDQNCIDFTKYHTENNKCQYIKTFPTGSDPSQSHAFAFNTAFKKLYADGYQYYCFLDHDNFPIKPFSVRQILGETKKAAGLAQNKTKMYLWPGCLMLNMYMEDPGLINSNPSHTYGLDTGGEMYKFYEHIGHDAILFMDEAYAQNPVFVGRPYEYYSLIYNQTFLHFVNGSGWNNSEEDQSITTERVNSLIQIVEKHLNNQ